MLNGHERVRRQVEISVLKKGSHVETIYFMVRTCILITI